MPETNIGEWKCHTFPDAGGGRYPLVYCHTSPDAGAGIARRSVESDL